MVFKIREKVLKVAVQLLFFALKRIENRCGVRYYGGAKSYTVKTPGHILFRSVARKPVVIGHSLEKNLKFFGGVFQMFIYQTVGFFCEFRQ